MADNIDYSKNVVGCIATVKSKRELLNEFRHLNYDDVTGERINSLYIYTGPHMWMHKWEADHLCGREFVVDDVVHTDDKYPTMFVLNIDDVHYAVNEEYISCIDMAHDNVFVEGEFIDLISGVN